MDYVPFIKSRTSTWKYIHMLNGKLNGFNHQVWSHRRHYRRWDYRGHLNSISNFVNWFRPFFVQQQIPICISTYADCWCCVVLLSPVMLCCPFLSVLSIVGLYFFPTSNRKLFAFVQLIFVHSSLKVSFWLFCSFHFKKKGNDDYPDWPKGEILPLRMNFR